MNHNFNVNLFKSYNEIPPTQLATYLTKMTKGQPYKFESQHIVLYLNIPDYSTNILNSCISDNPASMWFHSTTA